MQATRDMFQSRFTTDTQYQGVNRMSSDNDRPDLQASEYFKESVRVRERLAESDEHLSQRRSWFKTIVIQICGLLWLVPILFLVYVNLHGHIIGASAWCPGSKCLPDIYNYASSAPEALAAKYDRENHNLLGVLQLVAKALEVWFILICTWLVYMLTMTLAGRGSGIPIAYLTRPNEFAELPGLFDPLLWTSLPGRRTPQLASGQKPNRVRIWIFVFITAILCILCNLMGPATAVLVLPSLQYIETDHYSETVFNYFNAADGPQTTGFAWNQLTYCSSEDIAQGRYSCSNSPWAYQLDGFVDSCWESTTGGAGISQQDFVSYTVNGTGIIQDRTGLNIDNLTWSAPNRQVLQSLTDDYKLLDAIGHNYTEYASNKSSALNNSYIPYLNTVQTFVQREGPILSAIINLWAGYDNDTWWDSVINDEQVVRCFSHYNTKNTPLYIISNGGNYTRCVKWGTGWNNGYEYASFTIDGLRQAWDDGQGPNAFFETWTSDSAAYLVDGNVPEGFDPKCLTHGKIPSGTSCDWDLIFVTDPNNPLFTRSANTTTIQITANAAPAAGHPTTVNLMFDFAVFTGFTQYSLDPPPLTNPLLLASTSNLPNYGESIYIDPMWTLATWSADDGGLIGSNRSSTIDLLRTINFLWETSAFNSSDPVYNCKPFVDPLALASIMTTLGHIDFDVSNITSSTDLKDPEHPILWRNARIFVWAYGMSSRTAYLGIAVVVAGMVAVVAQFFLGLIDRRKLRSPMQLLVAALEHGYTGEFDACQGEKEVARVWFKVHDPKEAEAKLKFTKSL